MKSLKFLKEELLSKTNSSRELNNEEQKQIVGGAYTSLSQCRKYCFDGPFRGYCYVDYVVGNQEYWECRES